MIARSTAVITTPAAIPPACALDGPDCVDGDVELPDEGAETVLVRIPVPLPDIGGSAVLVEAWTVIPVMVSEFAIAKTVVATLPQA